MTRSHSINSSEAGFTLVELIFVSILLVILSAVLYGTLTGIIRTKTALESTRRADRTAEYVLSRLTRELSNRAAVALSVPGDNSQIRRRQADAEKYLLGKSRRIAGRDADTIRFTSVGSGQTMMGATDNVGIVEIEYRLEPIEGEASEAITSFSDDDQRFALVRIEIPARAPSDEIREQRRLATTLTRDLYSLQFRYRRNGKWINEWSQKRDGFPEGVEITVGVRGATGTIEKYRTAVATILEDETG